VVSQHSSLLPTLGTIVAGDCPKARSVGITTLSNALSQLPGRLALAPAVADRERLLG
jgi:hypothetical protein